MSSFVIYWDGDIVAMRGGSWLAKAIRWATRERGEGKTVVNHVGMVTEPGSCNEAVITEALNHVEAKIFSSSVRGKTIAVFRPQNVTSPEMKVIVDYMKAQVGRRYGYHKLLLHLLRKVKLPGKWGLLNLGANKWLGSKVDRTPICSYIVAEAYAQAGFDFGVKASLATPDDIWDFCVSNPDKYTVVTFQM